MTYRTPSIASGVASKRFRWSDGFCLTISISGDFQRHTMRRSRTFVGLMRSRDEYFVLRRSAAYVGQSPFSAVGPASIAPCCAKSTQPTKRARELAIQHRKILMTQLPLRATSTSYFVDAQLTGGVFPCSIAVRSRTESTAPAPSAYKPRTADRGAENLLRPDS